ncbi:MAG TPA: hypothetical protein VEN81_11405, partial [Planctomycetota bacterium]|nr:hypothetical protein [Planctomycetota bacterium]
MRMLVCWVALVGAPWVRGAQDLVPEFSRFEFARERIGHKVVADATLVNLTPGELQNLRVTAIFFDSERELRRSKPASIDRIAAG